MNLEIPSSRREWEIFVKENYWAILGFLLCLVALWQGLTLYTQMRSWEQLQTRVQSVLNKDPFSPKKEGESKEMAKKRSVEETFFYRPSSSYEITAIFDDRALINGKEMKVGDTIEKAIVEKIEVNAVTLKVEGEDNPKRIELHPGL